MSGKSWIVGPGSTRFLGFELEGNRRSGTSTLVATVVWTQGGTKKSDSLAIEAIPMFSAWSVFLSQFVDSLWKLLLALALPASVAVLGWAFQDRQQELVQQRQAWASMLPASHKNNVEYYLPMLTAIDNLKGAYEEDARQRFLFALLMVFRVNREVPGLYLTDQRGENLLHGFWGVLVGRVYRRLTATAHLSLVLDVLEPSSSYGTFLKYLGSKEGSKLKPSADLLLKEVNKWLDEHPEDFHLLFLYRGLLYFEINRIYTFWYQTDPAFPRQLVADAKKALVEPRPEESEPDVEELKNLFAELDEYSSGFRA